VPAFTEPFLTFLFFAAGEQVTLQVETAKIAENPPGFSASILLPHHASLYISDEYFQSLSWVDDNDSAIINI